MINTRTLFTAKSHAEPSKRFESGIFSVLEHSANSQLKRAEADEFAERVWKRVSADSEGEPSDFGSSNREQHCSLASD